MRKMTLVVVGRSEGKIKKVILDMDKYSIVDIAPLHFRFLSSCCYLKTGEKEIGIEKLMKMYQPII